MFSGWRGLINRLRGKIVKLTKSKDFQIFDEKAILSFSIVSRSLSAYVSISVGTIITLCRAWSCVCVLQRQKSRLKAVFLSLRWWCGKVQIGVVNMGWVLREAKRRSARPPPFTISPPPLACASRGPFVTKRADTLLRH